MITPARIAQALYLVGVLLVALGVGLIYTPAGVIAAGLGLGAFALLIFDVDQEGTS